MPAHHAKRLLLVVANARHSTSYGCALRLGVCAAEGLRNIHSKSDLAKSPRIDLLDLAKGSATTEIATFGGNDLLPRRLLDQVPFDVLLGHARNTLSL